MFNLIELCSNAKNSGSICYDLIHMRDPIETAELLAFTKTVSASSLSRAAAELGVPRATVGRRLARLEERLGVRLLRRTTRSLVLTEVGKAFYQDACVALEAVRLAEQSVRKGDDVLRGDLRVSIPPMMSTSFQAMLCDFAASHPDLRVQVHTSSEHVDILHDGYDVALRASNHLPPGLIARTLMRDPVIAVAAPAYLSVRGTPRTQQDLRAHRCLLGFARGELPQFHWPLASGGKLQFDGAFYSNDIGLLYEAAIRGLGIALLPLGLVARQLHDGGLVQVLPDVIGAEMHIALVYPERAFLPLKVRAFIDAVALWQSREPAPTRQTPSR